MCNIQDGDAIKELYKLWLADNAIANQKLNMYFVIQGIMVAALNGFRLHPLVVPLIGILASAIWLVSMARTQAYRKYWEAKIKSLTINKSIGDLALLPTPTDIQWYGKAPSWLILLGSPLLGMILWILYLCS